MNNPAHIARLIAQYHKGELNEQAMHELEREALNDPMLADALQGYAQTGKPQQAAWEQLDQRLQARVNTGSTAKPRLMWPLLAAAAALLIAIAAVGLWLNQKPATENNYAQLTPRNKTNITKQGPKSPLSDKVGGPAPADSIGTPASGYLVQSKPVLQHKLRFKTRPKAADAPLNADDILASSMVIAKNSEAKSDSLQDMVAMGLFNDKDAVPIDADTSTVQQALAGRVAGLKVESSKAASKIINTNTGTKTVTGHVVDSYGKLPLPGVVVQMPDRKGTTTTDANGYFKLNVPDTARQLRFGYVGYESQQADINKKNSLFITLQPQQSSLSEVVVVGYTKSTKKTANPYPNGGWHQFKTYLQQKAVLNGKKGSVKLSFNVDTLGALSNFKVLKTSDTLLNQPAIDVVKNGPAWIGAAKPREVVTTIRFKDE